MRKLVLFVLLATGCNYQALRNYEPPKFEPKPLEVPELKVFERANYELRSNKVFFWKDRDSQTDLAYDVESVLRLSERIEIIELGFFQEKSVYEKLLSDLDSVVSTFSPEGKDRWTILNNQIIENTDTIQSRTGRVEKRREDLQKSEQAIESFKTARLEKEAVRAEKQQALDEETSRTPTPDQQKIDSLKAEIAQLDQEIAALQKSQNDEEKKAKRTADSIRTLEEEIQRLTQEVETAKTTLASEFPEAWQRKLEADEKLKAIEDLKAKTDVEVKPLLQQIEAHVDGFVDIEKVEINLIELAANGTSSDVNQIKIRGWDLQDGELPKSFTSEGENPNIHSIEYEPKGAIFKFSVDAGPSGRYDFRIARARYEDPVGRVIFDGSVIRERNGKVSRGVVKLVDRVIR